MKLKSHIMLMNLTLLNTSDGINIADHCMQKSLNLKKIHLKETEWRFFSFFPLCGAHRGSHLIQKTLWIKLWCKQALKGNQSASHYLSSSPTTSANCFNFKNWHDAIMHPFAFSQTPACTGGACVVKCKWIWQLVKRAFTTNSYYEIII